MKRLLFLLIFYMGVANSHAQLITGSKSANNFSLSGAVIYVDANDDALVKRSAELLQQDIEMVTGKKPPLINNMQAAGSTMIIIGSIEKSTLLQQLIQQNKINISSIKSKWKPTRCKASIMLLQILAMRW